jgi:hypothetical protein
MCPGAHGPIQAAEGFGYLKGGGMLQDNANYIGHLLWINQTNKI